MDNFLSQEEIDALLNQGSSDEASSAENEADAVFDEAATKPAENEINAVSDEQNKEPDEASTDELTGLLTEIELDALGEIGNISMGSASTALSEILNQRVTITTPTSRIIAAKSLYDSFTVPYILVDVNFTDGLEGSNILVMKTCDAAVIADLMMGGQGTQVDCDLTEMQVSAVAEAMNQMIGSSATSMSEIFQTSVKITPPTVNIVDIQKDEMFYPWDENEPIVVIAFNIKIGDLVDSEIMKVLPIDTAKNEADLLFNPGGKPVGPEAEVVVEESLKKTLPQPETPQAEPVESVAPGPKNLDLILDVPLKVSVILGRTKRPIKEVLHLTPGSIVELERLANEPVEILVNGTLIAKGEVVVINENFGVRVSNIISPKQRLHHLKNA